MDQFEASHLEITKSNCTLYDETSDTHTPLDMVGTVATKRIAKNRKCCYFHGKIISFDEYEQRKDTKYKVFQNTMRLMEINQKGDKTMLLVDFECAAGYVNSSSKASFPNTRYNEKKLRHNVKLKKCTKWPGLFYYESERTIKPGEELFSLYYGQDVDEEEDDQQEAMEEDEVSDLDDDDDDDIVNTQNVHQC